MQEAEDEAIYAHHLQGFPSMDGCLHPDHSNNKSFPFVINSWMCVSKYIVFNDKESLHAIQVP